MYPFEEQFDMILIYGECQKNSVRAKNLFAERYPNRVQPSRQMFINLCDKLRQTGCLNTRKSKREKRVTYERNEIASSQIPSIPLQSSPRITWDGLCESC